MNNTEPIQSVDDDFCKFLDSELTSIGMSHKKTVERIKWYYETYFKAKQQQIVPELSDVEIRNMATEAWDKNDKTNPSPAINPYAFSYGYLIGFKAALQKQMK